jgi:hypothetical protein
MQERQKTIALPRGLEKVAELEKPEISMVVKLPFFREILMFGGRRYCRASMHTDMMGVFARTLEDLKPEIRKNLLIEGRLIDKKTWDDLNEHPAYDFFISRRECRGDGSESRDTIRILMPKNSKVTEKQVRNYIKLDFKPNSLSKKFGFRTAWYPASFIMRKARDEFSFNSLAPFLGAVNQFRIGSNDLKPGIVRMVGVRMMLEFERQIDNVADSILDHVSEKAIEASAKIFKVDYYYW